MAANLMMRTLLVALTLVSLPASLRAQNQTISVPNGDVSALISALAEAGAAPANLRTEIIIRGTYRLQYGQNLPPIHSEVSIRGSGPGATLTVREGGVGTLFAVRDRATLELSNLEITGFELDGALIDNSGTLELERVQFSQNFGSQFCFRFGCRGGGPIIWNQETGILRLNRVSIVDSGTTSSFTFPFFGSVISNAGQAEITNSQLFLSEPAYNNVISNQGSIHLRSSSLFIRDDRGQTALFGGDGAVELENTIIAGFDAQWCDGAVSLGHNLVDNRHCALDGPNDLVAKDPELIWAPVEADWNPSKRQILTHALMPLPDSLAVDSSGIEFCSGEGLVTSQRFSLDGDGDGIRGCDRGAVERVPSTVDMGGVNGLYFNPDADGHYLYIAETTFPVIVMWTTFDASGDPAWVFGIADRVRSNGRIVADAFINRNGRVRMDGKVLPAESEPWGTMDIRMTSCNSGRLSYQSDQPGFGTGVFEFERLAEVDQVGCVD